MGEGIEGALLVRLSPLRVVRAQRHPAHRLAAPPSPRGAARVGGGESVSDTGASAARQVRRWVGVGCQRPVSPQPSGPTQSAETLVPSDALGNPVPRHPWGCPGSPPPVDWTTSHTREAPTLQISPRLSTQRTSAVQGLRPLHLRLQKPNRSPLVLLQSLLRFPGPWTPNLSWVEAFRAMSLSPSFLVSPDFVT